MRRKLLIAVALLAALLVLALSPVCVPLSSAELAAFTTPIELRTDRDLYMKVFQRRDGRWVQCKTRLSRALFF